MVFVFKASYSSAVRRRFGRESSLPNNLMRTKNVAYCFGDEISNLNRKNLKNIKFGSKLGLKQVFGGPNELRIRPLGDFEVPNSILRV